MIGYEWTVYEKRSTCETEGILATGITDKPEKAKSLVETTLTEAGHATWGLLLRVAMDPWSSFCRSSQTADWPSSGEIGVCRRASDGGFCWMPLCPRSDAGIRPFPEMEK
jgi:hypothetical protein